MRKKTGQLLFRGALFVAIVAIDGRACKAKEVITTGEVFSNMCYRRKPVVTHISRSKTWQEGRRDILDWGCGGGALSLALAEQGAGKVVAIDLNHKAVNVAKQRLKFFPNATARRPQLGSKMVGRPGHVAYRNQFDMIVSFMGALSDGTAGREQQKITAKTAMDCAVDACRDGGYVVVAECETLRGLVEPLMVSLFTFAPNLVVLNWGQISLLSALAFLRFRQVECLFVPLAAREIARSIAMKKFGLSTMAWTHYFVHKFSSLLWHLWKRASNCRAEMRKAGLHDIKVTRRLCFRVAEVLEDTSVAKVAASVFNAKYYPGMVVIYQGRKQGKEN